MWYIILMRKMVKTLRRICNGKGTTKHRQAYIKIGLKIREERGDGRINLKEVLI